MMQTVTIQIKKAKVGTGYWPPFSVDIDFLIVESSKSQTSLG